MLPLPDYLYCRYWQRQHWSANALLKKQRRPGQQWLFGVVCSLLVCLYPGHANNGVQAEEISSDAASVKAALVFNLSKFVSFPESSFGSSDTHLQLCLLDADDALGKALQALMGKKVQERTLDVFVSNDIARLTQCHMIFFSRQQESNFRKLQQTLSSTTVLTMSDIDNFANRGGGIELYVENSKPHFKVNVDSIKKARLAVSAQVLKLATIVHDGD